MQLSTLMPLPALRENVTVRFYSLVVILRWSLLRCRHSLHLGLGRCRFVSEGMIQIEASSKENCRGDTEVSVKITCDVEEKRLFEKGLDVAIVENELISIENKEEELSLIHI